MDRREVLKDRRAAERRTRALIHAVEVDRRNGDRRDGDRRNGDRRNRHSDRRRVDDRGTPLAYEPVGGRRRTDLVLPPLSRLIPALVVVAVSLVDLAVAQSTGVRGWSLLLIAAAFPIAAYDLANPRRWRSRLAVVWLLVVLYVMAATAHITWM